MFFKMLEVLLFTFPFIGIANAVSIVSLAVPHVIPSGRSEVILDCDYRVEEWERVGLVLKWYVDQVHLVYQWIPPNKPQVLGKLKGRVDRAYSRSEVEWKRHRAMRIEYPDPSLSGNYSCSVSTFEDEDIRDASMIVWAPPKEISLHYIRPSEYLVNITCYVEESAPSPNISIYIKEPNGTRQEVDIRGRYTIENQGVWKGGSWGLILWAETPKDTTIGCTVLLPNTPHVETKETLYNPDLPIITTTTTTTTTKKPYMILNPLFTTRSSPYGYGSALSMSRGVGSNIVKTFLFISLLGQLCYFWWRTSD